MDTLFKQQRSKDSIQNLIDSGALETKIKNVDELIDYIKYGDLSSSDKKKVLEDLLQQFGIAAQHTAVMGDDLPDLPMLKMVGFPMAVADAVDEIKAVAKWRATKNGGHGAVREAVEFLLKSSGEWDKAVEGWG